MQSNLPALRVLPPAYPANHALCRSATISDAMVYYGADSLGSALQDSLTAELRRGGTDWVKAGFTLLGIVITESVKADINRTLCVPFRPVSGRRRSGLSRKRRRSSRRST